MSKNIAIKNISPASLGLQYLRISLISLAWPGVCQGVTRGLRLQDWAAARPVPSLSLSCWRSCRGRWSRCRPPQLRSSGTCYSRPASSRVTTPLQVDNTELWDIIIYHLYHLYHLGSKLIQPEEYYTQPTKISAKPCLESNNKPYLALWLHHLLNIIYTRRLEHIIHNCTQYFYTLYMRSP